MKIAVCTVNGFCLPVLQASIKCYASDHQLIVSAPPENKASNFGDAYNALLMKVFESESECIVANDDVVLNPTTMQLMLADIASLKQLGIKLGWVGARSDYVLAPQNIRYPESASDTISSHRWVGELKVKEASVISPIFAWISKESFLDGPFPPINWFSDNVSCVDLSLKGYKHYVSRSYVHHVGAYTTMGDKQDSTRMIQEATPWLWKNRPQYAEKWAEQGIISRMKDK